MRRLSIARSVQLALLGLTVVLTVVAAIGVASLYSARQDYEDSLSAALQVQAGSGRLLAAGVVEEATLRLSPSATERRRARAAYDDTLAATRRLALSDAPSRRLLAAAAEVQARIRRRGSAVPRQDPLQARIQLARLSARQDARIAAARARARHRSRRALVAIVVATALALLLALVLVARTLGAVRRPLDELVAASARLAAGDRDARVDEQQGPEELRALARSFNAMAADVEAARTDLEQERQRLDDTIRSLGDALVIVDADNIVAAANPRAAALAPELVAGREASPPADRERALSEEVVIERDGRTLAVTAAELSGQAGTVWTLRDVSERARLDRLKSEFVATASHELRSPLTSIKGFVELLAHEANLDDRAREFVDIVAVSTNRLVELVNDLLDVARMEAGHVEIQRRPADLAEIVRETALLLRPRIEAKHQRLHVDAPADLPAALIDPGRIRQVLTNLLTNAHAYTDEGGEVTIRAHASDGALVVEVSDDGRGMTPEQLALVFERFYRAEDGDRSAPGTGLGLSIVKSLVELHGGAIDVVSQPGRGTTFTVSLPRALERPGSAREALPGRRVLVVDDEPDVARVVAETLRSFGVRPTVVTDGASALRQLHAERYDAVTLDILMPGMTGLEVLRALRADPELQRVPVVVVSVFSGREALSGEWVVAKPIESEALADALGAAVLAGRVRVLAVGGADARAPLDAALDELGIEHEWAADADEVARRCATGFYEVAALDAALPDPDAVLTALDLRGRRLTRSIVVFGQQDGSAGFARLDAEPVSVTDAGAVVLGLLAARE